MDYDSSTKFISSLAKFLQSLCNGYVEFDNGVEVIGHIYLSVDTGKKIDYILNEKVCKTDENSVTFISNSFHAQPAEKPKPSSKRNRDTNESVKSPDDRQTLDNGSVNEIEPKSTNFGTIPRSQNQGSKGSSSLSSQKQLKRPASPGITGKGGHSSPSHKKNRSGDIHDPNVLDSNSAISTSSPGDLDEGTLHSAQGVESNVDGNYSETYQETFFHPGEEESLAGDSEDRDIKPSIDTDVTFVKEEFAPSSQIGGQDNDRTRDDSSTYSGMYHSNQPYSTMPGYSNQSSFGAHNSQRLNYGATGDRSDIYDSSQGSHLEGVEGSADPTVHQGTLDVPHYTPKVEDHDSVLGFPEAELKLDLSGGKVAEDDVRTLELEPDHTLFMPTVLCVQSLAGKAANGVLRKKGRRGKRNRFSNKKSKPTNKSCSDPAELKSCKKCMFETSDVVEMNSHQSTCLGKRHLTCRVCSKVLSRYDSLNEHLRGKHGIGAKVQCRFCGRPFKYRPQVYHHQLVCQSRVTIERDLDQGKPTNCDEGGGNGAEVSCKLKQGHSNGAADSDCKLKQGHPDGEEGDRVLDRPWTRTGAGGCVQLKQKCETSEREEHNASLLGPAVADIKEEIVWSW